MRPLIPYPSSQNEAPRAVTPEASRHPWLEKQHMATFRKLPQKDGTIHWQAIIRKEGRPARYASFHNRTDAVRWAKAQEVDIERDDTGITTEAHRHTLAQVLDRYRREVLPTKAPSTQPNYRIHLAWWESQLGTLRLADLRADRIDTCRDLLTESGKSPATVTRYLASLAAALTAAVRLWHWLPASPLAQVHKPTVSNERTRFLTEAELARLLTACRESTSPDLLLAVMLAISTGARQGEILNLRWRDLDLERGIITLRAGIETTTKGGSRGVALAGEVAPLLRERAAAGVDPAALVFPSRVTRRHPIDLRKPFETALARAGITDFHWHDLRHSAASFLAVDGASLLEIGAILGHRNPSTTKRYSHLTEQHAHDLTRAMSRRLGDNPAGERNHD